MTKNKRKRKRHKRRKMKNKRKKRKMTLMVDDQEYNQAHEKVVVSKQYFQLL